VSDAPAPLDEALDGIDRRVAGLPAKLASHVRAVLDRLSRANGAASLPEAQLASAATPFAAMLEAYARDVSATRAARADALLGCFWLYASVRAEDDLVDEPDRVDRASAYAVRALSVEADRALARAAGDAIALLDHQRDVIVAFAQTALWEVDVYRRGGAAPASRGWLGDKFLPLAIPLGALAIAAGRREHLPELTRLTRDLGRALQLVNDALNVAEDHAARRRTPVLDALYADGALRPGVTSRAAAVLATHAALDAAAAEAMHALDAAEAGARALDAPSLAEVVSARRAVVGSLRMRLLALALGRGAVW
jgi:hypothetical protein